MNEREGRSGRREMTAAGILAVVTSGLFAVNNAEVYRDGNMQPLVTVAAVLLSLFVCGWIERLMTRRGAASLSELLPAAVAPVIGLMLSLALVCVAALPIAEYSAKIQLSACFGLSEWLSALFLSTSLADMHLI